jgi:photosystem II stability/assembly factor-like uncharacterized protein
MKTKLFLTTALFVFISVSVFAQGGWTLCNTPAFGNRVDDIFMVDTQNGYAVSGDGQIVKTTDGGDNWITVRNDSVYHRSVEFINTQKGFVGGLTHSNQNNILLRTIDGGANWTDLSLQIDSLARGGICGMAIPDSNTIYGCGNWFQDSAYIVKSIDGGNTWSFIDMHTYAAHLIDMHFLNKDTGFAVGSGVPPSRKAVILYTTDGGQTWSYKFQDTYNNRYVWKIQHLTDQVYFASIEDIGNLQRILKSTDGGMTWNTHLIPFVSSGNGIQGVGFIDSLKGWAGGGFGYSYESNDGGSTWDTIPICWGMNRVFKVNDTLLFAGGGSEIWKYNSTATGITPLVRKTPQSISLNCFPNPANKNLDIEVTLNRTTNVLVVLLDETGRRIKLIDNTDKSKGTYQYHLNTDKLSDGMYYVILKTHEDTQLVQVVVTH